MKKILCFILLVGAVSSPFGSAAQTLPPFELQVSEETETVEVQLPDPAPKYTFGKTRFALDVGGSFRIAKIYDGGVYGLTSEQSNDLIKRMLYGVSYGASITGFFNTRFGFGAKFVGNHYSSSGYDYSDKLNTFYIGPEFIVRLPVGSHRNAWIFSASMGYVHYKEVVKYGTQELGSFSKGGFKTVLEAGFDFRIAKNVFFGPKITITAGSVPFEVDGETKNESLNAIEIGGGFRF